MLLLFLLFKRSRRSSFAVNDVQLNDDDFKHAKRQVEK